MTEHQGRDGGCWWEIPWEFPSDVYKAWLLFPRPRCFPHEGAVRYSLDILRKFPHHGISLDTERVLCSLGRDSVLVTVIECTAGVGGGVQLGPREPQDDNTGLSARLTPYPL